MRLGPPQTPPGDVYSESQLSRREIHVPTVHDASAIPRPPGGRLDTGPPGARHERLFEIRYRTGAGRGQGGKAGDGGAVEKDSVRRAVDVVGTLAAVDQVTISSEADGKVRAILADLGDRVQRRPGAHPARQREAAVHASSSSRRRSPARSRSTARPTRSTCRTIEKTPDVQKANADLVQATAGVRPRQRALQADAHLAGRRSTTRRRRSSRSRPATTRRCRTPGTCAPASRPPRRR